MRVVGIELGADDLRIVLVEGDATSFAVPLHDEFKLKSKDRTDDYVEIRKRLIERLTTWKPDVVCVEPLEPMALKRRIKYGIIEAAELRGIAKEAARAAGVGVVTPFKASVNANIGTRDAEAYVKDDVEWTHLGSDFLKKWRPAAVLALSYIRAS